VRAVAANRGVLARDPTLARRFLPDGSPPSIGRPLPLPELATTLEGISASPRDLYDGALAAELCRATVAAGGLLTAGDLARYEPEWTSAISVRYRGLDVCTTPPNSQGIAALQMLNVLSLLDDEPPGRSGALEALVRAKQAAFADRDRYVSDPTFVEIPVERLLGREHARRQLALGVREPASAPIGGDTVYVCAVDGSGNACSLIQSVYYPFGSGFVAGATGVVLQNRGHYFSLADDHPNRLDPGKRTLHTLMASMALRDGLPWLVFGTMGADGQPQTTVQVLQRVLDGATPAEAVAAPRALSGRMFLEDPDDVLLVEEGLGAETVAELRARGHEVRVLPGRDEAMGHAHAILCRADGRLEAGSDPRSDGSAIVLEHETSAGCS
jgi:gamma-glutamyltranspeptidase/glutathione hydrolase